MTARLSIVIRFIALLLFLATGFLVATVVESHAGIQTFVAQYGYPGLFLMSVVSGFNLIIPIPIAAFLPVFVVSGLGLWVSIIIMTIGMTLADTLAFFLGRVGRQVVHGNDTKIIAQLERLRAHHAWGPVVVMLFWASFAPLPNEVLAIPLGYMGFRARFVLPAVAVGNLVFNSLIAFGIVSLFTAI